MLAAIAGSLVLLAALMSQHAIAQEISWRSILNARNAYALAINANDHIFVVAGDTVYRSTDEGSNWTAVYAGPLAYHMVVNANGDIYVCSRDGILRSTNNGNSWTFSPLLYDKYGIAGNSRGWLFVAGCQDGVVRSTDNGNSWQPVLLGCDAHGIVIGPLNEIIAGSYVRGGPPTGFRSTDNGQSWEFVHFGFTCLAYHSGGTMFAGNANPGYWGGTGGGPYVFRSTNNGLNWDAVCPLKTYDVLVNADGRIFAAGEGGIAASTDNGTHWTEVNSGLTGGIVYSLERTSNGVLLAATPDGVFRSVVSTPATEERLLTPRRSTLSQNYPNPFNSATNVGFLIGECGLVSLKVYDVLGREVVTLVNELKRPGTYTVQFDGSGLASGAYFCRMSAADCVASKRLLLLK